MLPYTVVADTDKYLVVTFSIQVYFVVYSSSDSRASDSTGTIQVTLDGEGWQFITPRSTF